MARQAPARSRKRHADKRNQTKREGIEIPFRYRNATFKAEIRNIVIASSEPKGMRSIFLKRSGSGWTAKNKDDSLPALYFLG